MHYQILKEPMAILDVQMSSGEKITAESGAMVYMKGDLEIKTRTREGGFFKKIKVTALGGESFFVNDYIAHGDCSIGVTGPPLGDIIHVEVTPASGFIVQSGSYVASTPGVLLDTQWQGFTKGLFGSEFFMLKVSGQGDLFLNAYGGIIQKQVTAGEKIMIDNYHLVAQRPSSIPRNQSRWDEDYDPRRRRACDRNHRAWIALLPDKEHPRADRPTWNKQEV